MKTYTEEEAAGILGVSVRTLADMRRSGEGPRWVNVGCGNMRPRVRYRQEDLDEWLRRRTVARDGAE